MKLNVAYGRHGTVKAFEVTEDQVRKGNLIGKRLGQEVEGASFGEQFSGYVFKLRGGQDTEGFPMMYGVAAPARVSLLLKRGAVGFQNFRGRNGERRRKAVRGDIFGEDIAVLNVSVSKVGEKTLEGVTDDSKPRPLGPKRASAIRKLWNLPRDADVRKFVVKRKVTKAGKKDRFKAPAIQRLVTSKIRARRAKKVSVRLAGLKKSAQERREFLSAVTRVRMQQRQRKSTILAREKAHIQKLKAQKA
jgi:small subunit ribosomal protein S6e